MKITNLILFLATCFVATANASTDWEKLRKAGPEIKYEDVEFKDSMSRNSLKATLAVLPDGAVRVKEYKDLSSSMFFLISAPQNSNIDELCAESVQRGRPLKATLRAHLNLPQNTSTVSLKSMAKIVSLSEIQNQLSFTSDPTIEFGSSSRIRWGARAQTSEVVNLNLYKRIIESRLKNAVQTQNQIDIDFSDYSYLVCDVVGGFTSFSVNRQVSYELGAPTTQKPMRFDAFQGLYETFWNLKTQTKLESSDPQRNLEMEAFLLGSLERNNSVLSLVKESPDRLVKILSGLMAKNDLTREEKARAFDPAKIRTNFSHLTEYSLPQDKTTTRSFVMASSPGYPIFVDAVGDFK